MTNKWIKLFLAVLVIIAFHNFACYGQKIICEVRVNLEKLPLESQPKMAHLQDEVNDYINNFDWSEDEFKYDLHCEMEIAFDQAQSTSYEDRYKASFIISNGVDLQYYDKRWLFALNSDEHLMHSSSFHPFTSLLDFYINLILAHEYDKLKKFGGDSYNDKAHIISESAKFSTQYYLGWDRRSDLLQELMAQRSKPYRQLIWHYYTGHYFFEMDDKEPAKEHLTAAASIIPRVDKKKLTRFFDLNYVNFTTALEALGEKDWAARLSQYKTE